MGFRVWGSGFAKIAMSEATQFKPVFFYLVLGFVR